MTTTETAEKKPGPRKQIRAINQEIAVLKDRLKSLRSDRAALKDVVKAKDAARAARKASRPSSGAAG